MLRRTDKKFRWLHDNFEVHHKDNEELEDCVAEPVAEGADQC